MAALEKSRETGARPRLPVENYGSVMTTLAVLDRDTFPAASLAQAKSLIVPALGKVKVVGGFVLHPLAVARGAVAVLVSLYPVTPTLSVAVNLLIGTTSEFHVAGILNAVTVGGVLSPSAHAGSSASVRRLPSLSKPKVGATALSDPLALQGFVGLWGWVASGLK